MIVHQAESMKPELRDFLAFLQDFHVLIAVLILFKKQLPVHPAHHNVIDIRPAFLSRFSRHVFHLHWNEGTVPPFHPERRNRPLIPLIQQLDPQRIPVNRGNQDQCRYIRMDHSFLSDPMQEYHS